MIADATVIAALVNDPTALRAYLHACGNEGAKENEPTTTPAKNKRSSARSNPAQAASAKEPKERTTGKPSTGDVWTCKRAWAGQEPMGRMLYAARKLGIAPAKIAKADKLELATLVGNAKVKAGQFKSVEIV